MMTSELPKTSVAETLAEKIVALKAASLPATTTRKCEDLLIDIVGLCVTARNEDYIASALAGWDDDGPCTVIGHQRTLSAAGAAFVNGTGNFSVSGLAAMGANLYATGSFTNAGTGGLIVNFCGAQFLINDIEEPFPATAGTARIKRSQQKAVFRQRVRLDARHLLSLSRGGSYRPQETSHFCWPQRVGQPAKRRSPLNT